ncbi:MAG TPA: tyrosine-type recombinase/integrase [Candidatus Angelobacter sp.]|nr:tyrosine-type recombinase/integrase [Candidatus Angelobacter sp.]
MQSPHELQTMPFEAAAAVWLELHKEDISERTFKDYEFYIRSLSKKFKGTKLSEIHIGHVMEFRKERQRKDPKEGKRGAGAWCINHEINTLKQIMEMAGLWDLIEKHYKPLKVKESGPPRVLTVEEEEKFFRVVSSNPNWSVAYWATSLTNNTTAHGIELRRIQLKHIDLEHKPPLLMVVSNKTDFRPRNIPLNSVAFKQMTRLLKRAKELGAYKPDHFLFPFRIKKGEYDVNRPASPFFIRSAFRSMRKVLGPDYDWLKPGTLRNQCFTKLFESGAADETVISIGGHSAIKMSRYYSRIRATAKLDALEKIAPKSTGKRKDVENAG